MALFSLLVSVFGNIAVIFNWGDIRYIRFAVPLIPFLFLSYKRKQVDCYQFVENKFYKSILSNILIVSVLTFLTNNFLYQNGYTDRSFFNSMLMFLPPIFTFLLLQFFNFNELLKLIYFYFYMIIFQSIYFLLQNKISIKLIFASVSSNFITNSDFSAESIDPMFFSFFILFFIHLRDYKYVLLSFLFLILGGKRVALGAIALSIPVYYIFNYLTQNDTQFFKNRKTYSMILTIISLLIVIFWRQLYTGNFDKEIEYYTGLDTDVLLMGRSNIAHSFFENLKEEDNLFLGFGFGYTENILIYHARFKTLFHNDFLRLYLEMGILFFGYWLYILYRYAMVSSLSFSLLLILLIQMQTDNVILYDKVMIPFFLLFTFGIRSSLIKADNVKNISIL